jgi:hypothetical protein
LEQNLITLQTLIENKSEPNTILFFLVHQKISAQQLSDIGLSEKKQTEMKILWQNILMTLATQIPELKTNSMILDFK